MFKYLCLFLFCFSLIILNGCGSSSSSDSKITFRGQVDFSTGISNAPGFFYSPANSLSINPSTVVAKSISTNDTYIATINGNEFTLKIPAGDYEFYARNSDDKIIRMIKPAITKANNTDIINLKSTVVSYLIIQSVIVNGEANTLNEISDLYSLYETSNRIYNNALEHLKSDISDTVTATISERQMSFLALTLKEVIKDKIDNSEDLTQNDIITDTDITSNFQVAIDNILSADPSCTISIGIGLQFTVSDTDTIDSRIVSENFLTNLINSVTETQIEHNLLNNQFIVLTAQGNTYQSDQFSIFSQTAFDTPELNVYQDNYYFGGDNIIKSYGGKILIVNRTLSRVLIINGRTMKIEDEYILTGDNPQDIAFLSNSKAYVTFLESNYISIINPFTGSESGRIDISDYEESDGIANAEMMQIVEEKVFVTIQNLDGWTATENARTLVVNSNSDSVIAVIESNGLKNPYGSIDYSTATGKVYVGFVGEWWGNPATGILEIDTATYESRTLIQGGFETADTTINGAVTGVSIASSDTGYFIYSGTWPNYYIASFNPSTGEFYDTEIEIGNFWGNFFKDNSGNLYALNRDSTFEKSGVYKILPDGTINFSSINQSGEVLRNPTGGTMFKN